MPAKNRILLYFVLFFTFIPNVFAQLIVEVDNKLYFYKNNTENATYPEDYDLVEAKQL